MNAVALGISSRAGVQQRLAGAFEGQAQGALITFGNVDTLWRVLTSRRWQILQGMAGRSALAMRAVARLVQRDVKAVHSDISALINADIVLRTPDGVEFPFDAVHVDFTLQAA